MNTSTLLHALYGALAPWLALSLLFLGRNPHPGRQRITISLALATGILVIPISHYCIARWIALLEPNPSITLTALLSIALISRLGGAKLFRTEDWTAAWIFGAAASLILYPMGLGLSSIDPYAWGWAWHRPITAAALTTVLLLRNNRFGIVLLLALLGMLFHPMESDNAWDCLIDPFYGAISLIMIFFYLYKISMGHSGKARRKALP